MGKNYYFIEGTTDKDLIGFDSYVDSLNIAIKNDSKFIGLISEFGTGKSSLIKMFTNKIENRNSMDIITINLWNCDESKKNSKLDIHQIFLHQLIDKLKIEPRDYYKKKINKKYRLFDIKFGYKNMFCIYALFFYYILSSLEILGFINLFSNEIWRNAYYSMIVLLSILCLILYKPILSFNKEKTDVCLDENDTKDLYYDIVTNYLSKRKNKNKHLVICLEELDRFNDYNVVIKHIKEFYKFYKLTPENVTFIIAIKSANSLAQLSSDNDKNKVVVSIKNSYEKVFDFILNMNSINIQDFDNILIELLEGKKDDIPDGISIPDINRLDAWRYLYYGKNITIRDLKHRYNYAVSLYLSICESGLKKVDFRKCLYISYLEDECNTLYYKLASDSNVIKNILLHYAKHKNLDEFNENDFSNNDKQIIIDGILKKYINVDYVYYFFKFPKNKKSYSIHELNLYNAIFFNDNNLNLNDSIEKLTDVEIKNILKKRIDEDILPDIIFNYKKLIRIEYESEKSKLMNTINMKYNLISNYSAFESLVVKIRLADRIKYKQIFAEYLSDKKSEINNLQTDDKSQLRIKLSKLFKSDSEFFDYMFDDNNEIIKPEEMTNIDDLKVINNLTNNNIDLNYILTLKNIIKKEKYKTNIIKSLGILSGNSNVTIDSYNDIFNSINYDKLSMSDLDVKNIYNMSFTKLDLNNYLNLCNFIKKINKYNSFLDDKLTSLIDVNEKDQVRSYINIIEKFNFVSSNGLILINNSPTKFALNNNILDHLFNNSYYDTYVISNTLSKGLFDYEEDKKKELEEYYIDYFTRKKDWKHKVSNKMLEFLYNNVDYSQLSTQQLNVFVSCKQNKEIIKTVLDKENFEFINEYISKIMFFEKKDRKDVFSLISCFHKNNKLLKKAKENMKRLAGKNIDEKKLFDDRRR